MMSVPVAVRFDNDLNALLTRVVKEQHTYFIGDKKLGISRSLE